MAKVVTDVSSNGPPSSENRIGRSRHPTSARTEASMNVSLPPSTFDDALAMSTTFAPTPTSATLMK